MKRVRRAQGQVDDVAPQRAVDVILRAVAVRVLICNPLRDVATRAVVRANRRLQPRRRLEPQARSEPRARAALLVVAAAAPERQAPGLRESLFTNILEANVGRPHDRRAATGVEVVQHAKTAPDEGVRRSRSSETAWTVRHSRNLPNTSWSLFHPWPAHREEPDAAKHLARVWLFQVQTSIQLVAVHTAAVEAEIGDAEVAPEVIVMAEDAPVLSREVEVRDAAESARVSVPRSPARASPPNARSVHRGCGSSAGCSRTRR